MKIQCNGTLRNDISNDPVSAGMRISSRPMLITTEHPSSSYGIPVILVSDSDPVRSESDFNRLVNASDVSRVMVRPDHRDFAALAGAALV